MTTPTNNPRNPNYCDACHRNITANGECDCLNEGGWGWAAFHTEEEGGE